MQFGGPKLLLVEHPRTAPTKPKEKLLQHAAYVLLEWANPRQQRRLLLFNEEFT